MLHLTRVLQCLHSPAIGYAEVISSFKDRNLKLVLLGHGVLELLAKGDSTLAGTLYGLSVWPKVIFITAKLYELTFAFHRIPSIVSHI
jgi:hypothetical protein